MFFKVVTLALVFVVSQCHGHDHAYSSQHISMHHGKHVPVYVKVHDKHGKKHHHDFYAHPKYKYDYKIKDHHTGDDKTHHETRHGDVVKGTYSLHEPDGRRRVVDYTADKHTGFHASVRHEGHAKHIVPKKHKHHHKHHHDDPQKHDHHQFDGVSHSIPNFGSPNTGFTPSFGVPNLGSTPNFDGLPRFSGIPNRVPHFYGTPHSSRVPHFGGNSHDRVPNLKSNSKNRLPYFGSTSNGPMPNFDSNSNGHIPNFDSGPKDRSPHYDHIPRYGQTHHYDDFNGFDVPDFF